MEKFQEIFDKVVRHFAIQVVPAVAKNSVVGCRYRMRVSELMPSLAPLLPLHLRNPNDTLECAAGSLIPDSEYSTDLENASICELIDDRKVSLGQDVSDLVQRLQTIHDNAASRRKLLTDPQIGDGLRELARIKGLDASRVTW